MNWSSNFYVGFFVVLLTLIAVECTELTFELEDNARQCFFEDFKKDAKGTLEFQVISGGNYDVDVVLFDGSGNTLYTVQKKQYDSYTFTAQTEGVYKFCFSNEFSTFSHKVVYFDFQAGDETPLTKEMGTHHTALTQMETACVTIHEDLKIYIELFGEPNDEQPDSVPAKVQLQVRHLSASYFRAGDNEIKQYRQPIGSYRNIKFDRFSITKLRQCQESKTEGKCCSLFCLNEDDSRWQPMCTNQLTKGGSLDKLLGMEECKSPFGIYELKIPKDNNLACDDNRITNTNCRDIDRSKFTKMNVWANFIYWSDHYPTGPDDRLCRAPSHKRNKMPPHVHQFTASPDDKEGCC